MRMIVKSKRGWRRLKKEMDGYDWEYWYEDCWCMHRRCGRSRPRLRHGWPILNSWEKGKRGEEEENLSSNRNKYDFYTCAKICSY